jgi:nicotinamide-nucleotide amidase
MHAEIITIGDEILIGQTVDTNSAWMAKMLNGIGVSIHRITSIADEREAILTTLAEVGERAQLVLITGGLGPTRDDITKSTLCEYFETHLVMNDQVRERIEEWFERRGVPILEVNRKQAELPAACEVIENLRGTAQGMWFERDGVVYVAMPGVPYEMQGIVEMHLLDKIKARFERPHIEHHTMMTSGIGESLLSNMVADWEESLEAEGIHIAYLPSPGIVKVRLTAIGPDAAAIRTIVRKKAEEFEALAGHYIFGYNDEPLEAAVGRLLKERSLTAGCAESCTGGRIAAALAKHPGSSAFFLGGIVAYDNEIKKSLLGVDGEILAAHGAVSEATIRAMAEGGRKALGVDFVVATSGVAGPDGGSELKPVGLVWMAVAGPKRTVAWVQNFNSDRERNILRATQAALTLLKNEILEIELAVS